ncbi:hypothetical protein FORC38_0915 [Salmonella enterica]|nr:hypothetical protein FORC38_0915 [Salmonella enterica]AZH73346.1 hypothetical protein FORC80_0989 [Salmonella enterica subsp. enterica serovar Virchow]
MTGLSPLARGTLIYQYIVVFSKRFIPAGAGNTLSITGSKGACAVYPRWRGEHRKRQHVHNRAAGLSPLARGTH